MTYRMVDLIQKKNVMVERFRKQKSSGLLKIM